MLTSARQWTNLDRRGNWLDVSTTINGVTTQQTRTSNGVNEYVDIDPDGPDPQPAVSFTHDANGNLTLDLTAANINDAGAPTGQKYEYDEENRLTTIRRASDDALLMEIVHDAVTRANQLIVAAKTLPPALLVDALKLSGLNRVPDNGELKPLVQGMPSGVCANVGQLRPLRVQRRVLERNAAPNQSERHSTRGHSTRVARIEKKLNARRGCLSSICRAPQGGTGSRVPGIMPGFRSRICDTAHAPAERHAHATYTTREARATSRHYVGASRASAINRIATDPRKPPSNRVQTPRKQGRNADHIASHRAKCHTLTPLTRRSLQQPNGHCKK